MTGVTSSADGSCLASASTDSTIRVWNLANKTQIAKLTGHTGAVREVQFSPGGARLASAGQDATVQVWAVSGQ